MQEAVGILTDNAQLLERLALISPYIFLDTDIVKCSYDNFPVTVDLTQRVR